MYTVAVVQYNNNLYLQNVVQLWSVLCAEPAEVEPLCLMCVLQSHVWLHYDMIMLMKAFTLRVNLVWGFILAVGGTLMQACSVLRGPPPNNELVCAPNLKPKHMEVRWITKAGRFKF